MDQRSTNQSTPQTAHLVWPLTRKPGQSCIPHVEQSNSNCDFTYKTISDQMHPIHLLWLKKEYYSLGRNSPAATSTRNVWHKTYIKEALCTCISNSTQQTWSSSLAASIWVPQKPNRNLLSHVHKEKGWNLFGLQISSKQHVFCDLYNP